MDFKFSSTIIALVAALSMPAADASEAVLANGKLIIDTIPFALESLPEHGNVAVANGALVLAANRGTDLYANTDGSKVADKTPRVLFAPPGDFILTARTSAGFKQKFDGAALIVYGDKSNWAKLLFEFSPTGKAGISSTVAKGAGDDAHHGVREGTAIYLKVVRRMDMMVFYTSPDGAAWNMVRSFGWPKGTPLKVGFSAQSPVGDRFEAQFTDIKFRAATFKDFWQGE